MTSPRKPLSPATPAALHLAPAHRAGAPNGRPVVGSSRWSLTMASAAAVAFAFVPGTVNPGSWAAISTARAATPVATTAPAIHPRVGDKAPVFVLKTVDKGEARTLDSLVRGSATRGAVVVFLSARCPYVVQARQPLGELVKQYGAKVAFVGVNANQNESVDDVKADAAQNFAFPMLRDEGSKVADLYAAERTPEVFLVDTKGIIRYHGGVAELGPALSEFTAGRAVAKAEAKAFGCTIKRKP